MINLILYDKIIDIILLNFLLLKKGFNKLMKIRFAEEKDYNELALMKWVHCGEDDLDYGEHNLNGVDKEKFIS